MNASRTIRIAASLLLLSTASCSGGSGSGAGSSTDNTLSGVVSAAPVNAATVRVYALKPDGSQGTLLATTTTDSSGRYTVPLEAQSSPIVIVASGGSYNEEASSTSVSLGQAVLRTVLASTTAGQKVGVTPVSEIAVQNTLAAAANNGSVAISALIKQSNQMVASAMGLSDITVPPANPSLPASQASSTQSAQYAVVLAAISHLAKTATQNANSQVNSLDLAQALATSFIYNRSFSVSVVSGGATVSIPVPNAGGTVLNLATVLNSAAGGGATFETAMTASATAAATTLGYSTTAVPSTTFNSAPPIPAGGISVVLPSAPATLPATRPSVAGPPSPPPPFLVRDTPASGFQSSLRSVKVDASGNIYSVGYRAATNLSSSAVLLVKYAPSGEKVWETSLASGTGSSSDLVIDAAGNIIIAGSGRAVNGQTAGTSGNDVFIAKYSPSKTLLMTVEDTTLQGNVNGLTLDSSGNIVIVGSSAGSAVGSTDLFIAKYAATGGQLWAKRYGASGLVVNPSRVALDKSDNIFVSGTASNSSNTNGLDGRTKIGTYDFFLKKTDVNGNYLWTVQGGSSGNAAAQVQALAIDSTGAAIVAIVAQRAVIDGVPMINNYDTFLSKYSSAGVRAFTINDGAAAGGGTGVQDMVIDSADRVYVTGNTQSPLFGQPLYSSVTQGDMFVSRYTTSGTRVWTAITGAAVMNNNPAGSSGGLAITLSPTGTVIVAGQSSANVAGSSVSSFVLLGFSPAGLHQ